MPPPLYILLIVLVSAASGIMKYALIVIEIRTTARKIPKKLYYIKTIVKLKQ